MRGKVAKKLRKEAKAIAKHAGSLYYESDTKFGMLQRPHLVSTTQAVGAGCVRYAYKILKDEYKTNKKGLVS